MRSMQIVFRGKEYKVEVYPYSETDRELVWSIYRKNTYGWDKMRLFTKSQVKMLPKTVAKAAVAFYTDVKGSL